MNNDLLNEAIEDGRIPEAVAADVRLSQDNQAELLADIAQQRGIARVANANVRQLTARLENERERISDEIAQYLDGAQVYVREREERDNLQFR